MKRHRLVRVLVWIAVLTWTVPGCTRTPGPLTTEPDFAGVVSLVEPGGTQDVIGRVHAEWDTGEHVDKYVIAIHKDTALYVREGEGHRDASFTDFLPGAEVQFWFDGPVRESYPMQADAKQAMIVAYGSPVEPTTPAYPPPATDPTLEPYPPPSSSTGMPAYPGMSFDGGALGTVWNLAALRYNIEPDSARVVVEMAEDLDQIPFYRAVLVDNADTPFPTGHDDAWGMVRIDLEVSDLYARESPAFEALPLIPDDNPLITRIGHLPTFDDAILGFSIGMKQTFRYEIHELTDPVRIAIDVWCDGLCA